MTHAEFLAYTANVALGIFLLALAWVLARRSPDLVSRPLLGAYLGLVGLGYVLDGLAPAAATFGYPANPLRHASLVPTVLDPPLLLLFALAYAKGRLTPARAALAAAPGVLLALLLLVDPPPVPYMSTWPYRAAYLVELTGFYALAYVLLLRAWLTAETPLRRDQTGTLVLAFGVIVLPRLPLLVLEAGVGTGPTLAASTAAALVGLLALGLLAVVAYARAGGRLADRPATARTLRALTALLAFVALVWVLAAVPPFGPAAFALAYSSRWFLFVPLLAAAIARHESIGLPRASQEAIRRGFLAVVVVLALFGTAAFVAALADTPIVASLGSAGLLVAVVGVLAYALRRAVPGAAHEEEWRRARVYRAHYGAGASPEELAALASRLGLDDEAARRARELVDLEASTGEMEGSPEPGARWRGRYDVERILGVGAFGRAFLARDAHDGGRVVLKEALAVAGDEEVHDAFRAEARALLAVRHPRLVRLLALEPCPGGFVLVLDHAEGRTLRESLASGPLTSEAARAFAGDVLGALGALHAAGFVHRDVKPDNIVLDAEGRATLLDFGAVSRLGKPGGTRAAGHAGTPGYMSPEQRRGQALAPASDLYSLAVVLREALTGPGGPRASVPPEWEAPLARALAASPDARFPDAASMLRALPKGPA